MLQKYKVYFAYRPVLFTDKMPDLSQIARGTEVIRSKGKFDTMLIQQAIDNGARQTILVSDDVEKTWNLFSEQFENINAAGGIVVNDEGKMLFIFRNEKWDLPKGKVEDGESMEEAALREVEEECSIFDMQITAPLSTTYHTYIQDGIPILKRTHWFTMKYSGTVQPKPQLIEGITSIGWFSWSELEKVKSNTYSSVMDVVNEFEGIVKTEMS